MVRTKFNVMHPPILCEHGATELLQRRRWCLLLYFWGSPLTPLLRYGCDTASDTSWFLTDGDREVDVEGKTWRWFLVKRDPAAISNNAEEQLLFVLCLSPLGPYSACLSLLEDEGESSKGQKKKPDHFSIPAGATD